MVNAPILPDVVDPDKAFSEKREAALTCARDPALSANESAGALGVIQHADELTRKIADLERRLGYFREADTFTVRVSIPWAVLTKERSCSATLEAHEIRAPIVAALEEHIARLRRARDFYLSAPDEDEDEDDGTNVVPYPHPQTGGEAS
jgi:hypothetical protein